MPYARLAHDVDLGEEAELRRLESALVGLEAQAAGSCATVRSEQASALPSIASADQAVSTAAADARGAVVTGYAEYQASLAGKKRTRRAIKIDLKLPEASTAMAGVPRRKHYPEGETGRLAWKAAFNGWINPYCRC